MAKRKTTEEYAEEVNDLTGGEYSMIGEYVNNKTPVSMRHNGCGHEFSTSPINFLAYKTRCPRCANAAKRKTTDEFREDVKTHLGDGYTVIGKYVSCSTPVMIRHESCGYEYSVTPSVVISNCGRCPNCMKKHKKDKLKRCKGQRKTFEQFKNEALRKDNSYEVIGDYINAHTPILMRHKPCGTEFMISPNNFLSHGKICQKCNPRKHIKRKINIFMKKNMRRSITDDMFKKEAMEKLGDDFEIIGTYKNTRTKITVKHKICGKIFEAYPYDILYHNQGCSYCKKSKGEKVIGNILSDKKIAFKEQYSFDDCIEERMLRFDFAVFDDKNELSFLIEFDGAQHFKPSFYTEKKNDNFEKAKKRDNTKNDYCLKNNILLLRIPYWEKDNIEEILKEALEHPENIPSINKRLKKKNS